MRSLKTGENYNHDQKVPENAQTVLVRLKRQVLSDIEKPIPTIYDEEFKKFVSICSVFGL